MIQDGNLRTTAGASVRPSSRVARSEAIIFTELDYNTVVMMDIEVGRYYELNEVGARIWELAEIRPRVAEVCEKLVAEYQVAPAGCAEDVQAFLGELHRLEVLHVQPGAGVHEVGNGGRNHVTPSISGRVATAAQQGMARAKLAWTPPAVRVLAIGRRTRDGTYDDQPHEQMGYAANELPPPKS